MLKCYNNNNNNMYIKMCDSSVEYKRGIKIPLHKKIWLRIFIFIYKLQTASI